MNMIELTVLIVITGSIPLLAKNKIRSIHIKLLALSISILISKLFGARFGNTLVFNIGKLDKNIFNSQVVRNIAERIAPTIGTIIVFLQLSIIIKSITSFINGEINSDIRIVICDRLMGALNGLFIVVGFSFSFAEVVRIALTRIKLFRSEVRSFVPHNNDKGIKFVANLN